MRVQGQTMHAEGTSRTRRFMRCLVGGATYCLNMAWVRGIRRAEELQLQSPGDETIGRLRHEAHDIPVFSLAARLKLPGTTVLKDSKVVLCNTSPQLSAWLVERVDGIIDVPPENLFPLPRLARNHAAPFVEEVVKHAGTMLLALSPAGLHPQARHEQFSSPTAEVPDVLPTLTRIPPAPSKQGTLLCFTTVDQPAEVWSLSFGLSVSQVAHVQQSPALCVVPGAAPHVLGLADWQGCPLAVIDLSRRLGGVASMLATDNRLLIARTATTPAFVSFPVRPQIRLWSLPLLHQPSDRPLSLQASLLHGRFDLAHETLVIPDLDRLIIPQEEQGC